MINMATFKRIALTLVIIGAINWGLIGLFQFDLVAAIFGGQGAGLSRVLYTLIGISGLVSIAVLFDPLDDSDTAISYDRSNRTGNVDYGVELGDDFDYEQTRRERDKRFE